MPESIERFFAKVSGKSAKGKIVFHPSQTCPECGSKLFKEADSESVWCCPNLDCPVQIRARIAHWCSREAMDIAGVDTVLVAKLVAAGLARDVVELYRLKIAELAGVEGMDKNSATQFVEAIAASRQREPWRLLFGLEIPGVTAAEAQSLCRHFGSVDAVFAASATRLSQVNGVRLQTAQSINHWHGDSVNRRLMKRLFKAGLNFK